MRPKFVRCPESQVRARRAPSNLDSIVDDRPVTEFRANAAQFLEQVRQTGEPVILTQHGRSAAVLLDIGSYESMIDELALLRDTRVAEEQIAAGKSSSHTSVSKTLRARLTRLLKRHRSRREL